MADYRYIKLQSVIFAPLFDLTNQMKVINWFSKAIDGVFEGKLAVLPIPENAPPEIPRIQFDSPDNAWKLSITLNRIDLYFLSIAPDATIIPMDKFIDSSKRLLAKYKEEHTVHINRVALVTERVFTTIADHPAKYLIEKFCKEEFARIEAKSKGPLSNSVSFELHNRKNYRWNSFPVNSWVRLKATTLIGYEDEPVLFMQNDLNTQLEKAPEESYSAEQLKTFFSEAPKEIEKIVQLYFG